VLNRGLKQDKLNILRAAHLSKFPWLVHGFSTRTGGFSRAFGGSALNLGFTKGDSKAAVERNRAAFLRELGVGKEPWPLVTLRQVHSDIIRCVDSPAESQLA
jgi:copper oxidase (laccase) domain-containing protein